MAAACYYDEKSVKQQQQQQKRYGLLAVGLVDVCSTRTWTPRASGECAPNDV